MEPCVLHASDPSIIAAVKAKACFKARLVGRVLDQLCCGVWKSDGAWSASLRCATYFSSSQIHLVLRHVPVDETGVEEYIPAFCRNAGGGVVRSWELIHHQSVIALLEHGRWC